jgi:glycosyltransferase involved in cell wall biosynthesis
MSAPQVSRVRRAHLKPAPVARLPFLSVIVPVRNEARYIGRLLGQLLSQQYPPDSFEVLVADGQSTDTTRAIVSRWQAKHPHLRLLDNPRRLSSAGRNLAVQAARGEIVVLIDGHCEVDNPRYFQAVADAFERTGAACVGRPQPLDVRGAAPLQRAIAAARASRLGHHPSSFIYSTTEQFVPPQSVAIAYRRSLFTDVGMFDEEFDACEDVEFNHRLDRAGFRCFFTPRVRVRYQPRSTLRGLLRQMFRYGRGRARLLRKHPETLGWGTLAPAVFVLMAILGGVAVAASRWLALGYAGGFGLYALALLVTSLTIAVRKRDAQILPWFFLVFPAIHFGAGAGLLYELTRGFWGPRPGVSPRTMEQTCPDRTPLSTAQTG